MKKAVNLSDLFARKAEDLCITDCKYYVVGEQDDKGAEVLEYTESGKKDIRSTLKLDKVLGDAIDDYQESY